MCSVGVWLLEYGCVLCVLCLCWAWAVYQLSFFSRMCCQQTFQGHLWSGSWVLVLEFLVPTLILCFKIRKRTKRKGQTTKTQQSQSKRKKLPAQQHKNYSEKKNLSFEKTTIGPMCYIIFYICDSDSDTSTCVICNFYICTCTTCDNYYPYYYYY